MRLHDLRHGAASLAHTAGADLKTIQDQLGHASIVLTADTYTSVLPDTQRKAAEATARLVLTAARIRPRPHDRTPAHQQDPPQAGPDSHAADAAGRTIPSPAVDASTWTNIAYHAQTEAAVTFGRSTRRAPT